MIEKIEQIYKRKQKIEERYRESISKTNMKLLTDEMCKTAKNVITINTAIKKLSKLSESRDLDELLYIELKGLVYEINCLDEYDDICNSFYPIFTIDISHSQPEILSSEIYKGGDFFDTLGELETFLDKMK